MEDQKEEVLTPYTLADRNEILVKYANFSFKEALAEVKDELQIEKDFHRRLGLLAAQSWILRKKLYVALHDPYISALSEVEDTDIFDGLDEDEYNEYDSLFDEDTPEAKIEILIIKQTTIGGKKIAKDTINMPRMPNKNCWGRRGVSRALVKIRMTMATIKILCLDIRDVALSKPCSKACCKFVSNVGRMSAASAV